MARVELFYFPRPQPEPRGAPALIEVVLFRTRPQASLQDSREGETVALFMYAGDAVAYATQRQREVQVFMNSEGEVEAIFAEVEGETDYATRAEGGYIHTFVNFVTGTAFAQELWGIVVRPSPYRLSR